MSVCEPKYILYDTKEIEVPNPYYIVSNSSIEPKTITETRQEILFLHSEEALKNALVSGYFRPDTQCYSVNRIFPSVETVHKLKIQ